ncbi:malonate decarboxylase holo-ACP synthase [Rhizobium sp.]|jgi:phosphoribosyl-dephospho-CoA transferase|uniref:malonate decarboxylase holo-ACP synthase n=1 Tax=Rhizobium sp. TaxID=391 RepID=UPI002AA86048
MVADTVPFWPHDLVGFDPLFLLNQERPDWVMVMKETVFFAVIRRVDLRNGALPIGIRGKQRHERWGGWLDPQAVRERWTPESLVARISDLPGERLNTVPALAGLRTLYQRLEHSTWRWGPTGSVGFELATGLATATQGSDLDLIVRCREPVTKQEACCLLAKTFDLGVRCDIALETPIGAVSLIEFTKTEGAVALKTLVGPKLTTNPWVE